MNPALYMQNEMIMSIEIYGHVGTDNDDIQSFDANRFHTPI